MQAFIDCHRDAKDGASISWRSLLKQHSAAIGVRCEGEATRRRDFHHIVRRCAGGGSIYCTRQRPSMPVVGFIGAADAESNKQRLAAFLKRLEELGYIDGKNVAIEYRWARQR